MEKELVIRKPIIVVLGHVDAGKTKVLDRIRGTAIVEKEAGGITQHIGATEVPIETINRISGELIKKYGFNIKINGLLFIDTPGHEAFTNLRKRGGSIADLAILVVDINKGLQEQTKEAISILKSYKTPFIVAANKIDMIKGWHTGEMSFTESVKKQQQDSETQLLLDEKLYALVGQLHEQGFVSERFDRCTDLKKEVVIIPCCAKSGEGMPEILMYLAGLSQKYLEESLKINVDGPGKGTIMEVKDERGLGTTIDVIVYDGSLRVGDTIVLGARNGTIITKIRALLEPKPLDEMRMPSEKFTQVKEVHAASGVKIAAPLLEDALSGSPVLIYTGKEDAAAVEKEIERVKFGSQETGVLVRADTLGSLEAICKLLSDKGITIKGADIGEVTRKDIMEMCSVREKNAEKAVVFAFNVKTNDAATAESDAKGIKIFSSNIIYSLMEEYDKWLSDKKKRENEEKLSQVVLPAKIRVLRDHIFRNSRPAVCGVKVICGRLRHNVRIMNKEGEIIGTIESVQKEGKSIAIAKESDEVAISINGAVFGRNVFEDDVLYTYIPAGDFSKITSIESGLTGSETALLEEIRKIEQKEIIVMEATE